MNAQLSRGRGRATATASADGWASRPYHFGCDGCGACFDERRGAIPTRQASRPTIFIKIAKGNGGSKTCVSAKRTGLANAKLRADVAGRQEVGTRRKFFSIRFVWNEMDSFQENEATAESRQ